MVYFFLPYTSPPLAFGFLLKSMLSVFSQSKERRVLGRSFGGLPALLRKSHQFSQTILGLKMDTWKESYMRILSFLKLVSFTSLNSAVIKLGTLVFSWGRSAWLGLVFGVRPVPGNGWLGCGGPSPLTLVLSNSLFSVHHKELIPVTQLADVIDSKELYCVL